MQFTSPEQTIEYLEFDRDPNHKALQYKRLHVLICNEILASENRIVRPDGKPAFYAIQLLTELKSLSSVQLNVKGLTDLTKSDVTSENVQLLEAFFDALPIDLLPASLYDLRLFIYLEGREIQRNLKFGDYQFLASLWVQSQPSKFSQPDHIITRKCEYHSFTKVDYNCFREMVGPLNLSRLFFMSYFSARYPNIQVSSLSSRLSSRPSSRLFSRSSSRLSSRPSSRSFRSSYSIPSRPFL